MYINQISSTIANGINRKFLKKTTSELLPLSGIVEKSNAIQWINSRKQYYTDVATAMYEGQSGSYQIPLIAADMSENILNGIYGLGLSKTELNKLSLDITAQSLKPTKFSKLLGFLSKIPIIKFFACKYLTKDFTVSCGKNLIDYAEQIQNQRIKV